MATFQIVSDLHLEFGGCYGDVTIPPKAPYLALLGDIGVVKEDLHLPFTDFLIRHLRLFKIVFYVAGNHEPYWSNWTAVAEFFDRVRTRADELRQTEPTLGEFIPLDKTRYDLNDSVTILGCTLFSNIDDAHIGPIRRGLRDFTLIKKPGRWCTDDHNNQHELDLAWLNEEVERIEDEEMDMGRRKIVIFTHYSPTTDPRAADPQHAGSEIASAFQTDLSREKCWTSERVRLWAFGHTHWNCDFVDDKGKRVYANQRGYQLGPRVHEEAAAGWFDAEKTVTV
ncbi:hypothetical protein OQA88_8996 [Cercophora sp. LCS_1]